MAARVDDRLIGYAMACQVPCAYDGTAISWVTQLMVHSEYRKQLVGSTMLNSVWGFSNDFAWGLASANPFAVRALEKATRRRCVPGYAAKSRGTLERAFSQVPYLQGRAIDTTPTRSVINTEFFQDHGAVEASIEAVSQNVPWTLGALAEGEEWLACTFRRQREIRWTDRELEQFTKASSELALAAYNRMAVGQQTQQHPWARQAYADREADFLVQALNLSAGSTVLDFGCGFGRHAIALAKKGVIVHGVDFSEVSVHAAREKVREESLLCPKPTFSVGDCRTVNLERQFDAGICLYDVIGSLPDDAANFLVLENMLRHVRPGGYVAISVMSYVYTLEAKPKIASNGDVQQLLGQIKSSRTMEQTGDVFDPSLIVLDAKKHVAYRKEVFQYGSSLPQEIVVRDRRYDVEELKEMARRSGIEVERCGYVRAGNFAMVGDQQSRPTKEILLTGRKALM